MSKLEYNDYWFQYVINEDPYEIKGYIKEEYFNSQGYNVHLDIYDKDSTIKPTVIFIHGTAIYSRFYVDFFYQLSQKGYRVIAPDLPGHGKSNGIRGHFTMELITKVIYDLTTYCRERYGNEIYIMGSSLGGITSFYCWAYDKRLKGAICHNAAILNEKAYKDIIKVKGMVKLLVPLVPTLAKFFPKIRMSVWKYLDLYKLAKSKEVLNRIELLFKDPMVTQKYTLTSLKTQMRAPLANPIEKVKAPILLLVGGKDFLFSIDFMKEIYDRLPSENKDIKIIENASHLIFQENLKESIQIITQWLVKNK